MESGTATLAAAELPETFRLFFPDPPGEKSYPIVTFSWILLYQQYDKTKAVAIRDLFTWCLQDGQHEARALGYVPLADNVVAAGPEALEKIEATQ